MSRWLTTITALVLLAGPAAAQKGKFKLTDAPVKTTDFVYKKTPEGELTLHGFFPADWKPTDRRPVVVFFFGGGWKNGSYTQFVPQAEYFASRGLVALSADYRIESKHKTGPEKAVEDAKSAIRWVRANADKLGIDPDKVVASGGSAGGHLAAATAMVAKFDSPDDPKVSAKPNALVLFNPFLNGTGRTIKGTDGSNVADAISCTPNLVRVTPPAAIFFGTKDPMLGQGKEYVAAAMPLGVRAELWTADGQPHTFFNRPPWLELTTRKADEFLASLGYLKGEPTIKLPADGPKLELFEAKTGAVRPPNVVVILADDIGYGDLSCYGATKVQTPNCDRLAAQGMRFTDAHTPAAVCTPTRYALMTGQYAWRHPPGSRILSGVAPLSIKPGTVTVPSLLKAAGYATGIVGKWHLGLGDKEPDYNAEIRPGPREVGFDYSFIIPATGDRTPCVYVENGRVVGLDPNDPIRVSYAAKVGTEPTGKENPDLLTNQKPSHGHDMTIVNGISRIGWMTGGKAARWKDEDMADDLVRHATAFIDGNRDKPFFLYFATHDIHVPRVPHPRFRGKSGHGLRGDALVQFDWQVGEVLAALDRNKLAENTLVILTSDNGGVMDDGYQDGSGTDTSGHKCNGPLRGFKGGLYEGGHRVPFIARWPGNVPAGKTSGELIGLVDVLATVAAVTGKELPKDAGPDSFNILPALLSEKPEKSPRHSIVMQAGGGALAYRSGPWKYIPNEGKKKLGPPELYNLADDPGETKNLAATNPADVRAMAELLRKARETPGTRPGR
jgi:arylsulfatase A-like enzyme/acetyl esterase/lipase